MQIIRVDKTASTNAFLKDYVRDNKPTTSLCVVTNIQDQGRGQMGTVWQSEPFKNLTFSVFIPSLNLAIDNRFALTMCAGLAVLEGLQAFSNVKLHLKWPNDIMAGSRKIGGILIENQLGARALKSSIIGIGVNVNQTQFEDLPHASSLKLEAAQEFQLDNVLETILNAFESLPYQLKSRKLEHWRLSYEEVLFKKDKMAVFSTEKASAFNGIIRGVTNNGLLKLETDNGVSIYDLKEVKMLL